MTRLTADAAKAYIDMSLTAFQEGVLPLSLLEARMRFVQQHSDPASQEYRTAAELAGDALEEDWPDEPRKPQRGRSVEGDDRGGLAIVESGSEFEPPMLRFIAPGTTGLSMWYFNQYDPDYFPSIPHGHHTQAQEKLYAYLGHVYRGSKQVRREPRSSIVALWNEPKFRTFARAAITWYTGVFPNYVWRVKRPLRIPRRRP